MRGVARRRIAVGCVLFGLLCAPAAAAGSYGDFSGLTAFDPPDTLTYRNVRDDGGGFGAPLAKPFELVFAGGSGIGASCEACDPTGVEASDLVRLDIELAGSLTLAELDLRQTFDYFLSVDEPDSYAAHLVQTNAFLVVQEVGFQLVDPITLAFSMTMRPTNNGARFEQGLEKGTLEGRLVIDVYDVLWRSGFRLPGEPTRMSLSVETTVQAFAGPGGFAEIRTSSRAPVLAIEHIAWHSVCLSCEPLEPLPKAPEPSTGLLVGLGLAGLAASRRERSAPSGPSPPGSR